jgi:outer membrane protein OmpA-like peptidoglycan-associated protein
LAAAQLRIQGLEQAIDALKASQAAALDKAREEAGETVAELQRQLREALAQAERSTPKSRSWAEQMGRDYAALGACYSERGIVVTLGESDLRFAPGQGSLSNPAARALDKLAELLKRDSGLRALVEGHTDSQGNAEKNLALSTQRAESVRQALIGRGVEPERVQAEGLGEANPVATNASEAGRSRNRRVEIRLSESPSEV